MTDLTFAQFQELNARRCNEAFDHGVDGWEPAMWALAICGEAGELANRIKKVVRDRNTVDADRQGILSEIADVITYCDLLMSRLGASTGEELMRKFDIVSERVGWHSSGSGRS